MRSGEATNTNFIVFSLTRTTLESTIYGTRGEHANHYTTAPFSVVDVKRQFSIRYRLLQSVRSRWRGYYFDGGVCIQFEMKTYMRNNIHFVLSSTDCYHKLYQYCSNTLICSLLSGTQNTKVIRDFPAKDISR